MLSEVRLSMLRTLNDRFFDFYLSINFPDFFWFTIEFLMILCSKDLKRGELTSIDLLTTGELLSLLLHPLVDMLFKLYLLYVLLGLSIAYCIDGDL